MSDAWLREIDEHRIAEQRSRIAQEAVPIADTERSLLDEWVQSDPYYELTHDGELGKTVRCWQCDTPWLTRVDADRSVSDADALIHHLPSCLWLRTYQLLNGEPSVRGVGTAASEG